MKLEDFFLSEATKATKEAYAELPARATSANLGALTDNVVILDTETTGLSVYSAELIEIAALKLVDDEVAEEFQTFVKPQRPIPEEITKLTSITNEDVAHAPSEAEAIAQLKDFVGDVTILAHNASFDKSFITQAKGGNSITNEWVDTLAFSRITLPLLKNHKLQDMASAFGCYGVSHRAIDDVGALADMWRIMLCAALDFDASLLDYLATIHPKTKWQYRAIFAELSKVKGLQEQEAGQGDSQPKQDASFSLLRAREALKQPAISAQGPTSERKQDAEKKACELEGVDPEELSELFSENGALGAQIKHFEKRKEQAEMAIAVGEALQNAHNLAIEVGTGVGKTLAYALPLAAFAKTNNITCGIATKTNILTDQIISQEAPRISAALGQDVTVFPLKGFDHYPCLRKAELAGKRPLPHYETPYATAEATQDEMLTAIATVVAYATHVERGDLDTLGIRWNMVPRSLVTTTSKECLRHACPYYKHGCMLHGARRAAAAADIVVTNHSLLLCDIASEGRILPPVRHWVVDEAHGFSNTARKQWAKKAASDATEYVFQRLGTREVGLIARVMKEVAASESPEPRLGLLSRAASFLEKAHLQAGPFFEGVHQAVLAHTEPTTYDTAELYVDEGIRETPEYAHICVVGEELLETCKSALHALQGYAENVADATGSEPPEFAQPISGLSEFCSALEAFLGPKQPNHVYSMSSSHTRKKKRPAPERICVQELNLGDTFVDKLYANTLSCTFCSGTMAVGDNFAHFNEAVGFDKLPPEQIANIKLPSPYDFDGHMAALVVGDIAVPGATAYIEELAKVLVDVHVSTGGGVLTLFTNRREMEAVYKRVAPELSAHGLTLSQQARRANVRRLAQDFFANESHSLFGLKAFWEGFDAGGDTLRAVVIPRLPFASPQDPLVREREREDKGAFGHYSLPEAILAVNQAAGRLIRGAFDTGILVLADSRLTTRFYGKQFLDSLPTSHIEIVSAQDLGHKVTENIERISRNL